MEKKYPIDLFKAILTAGWVMLSSMHAFSQLTGPSTGIVGETGTYTYNDGFTHSGMQWTVSSQGQVIQTSESGTDYSAIIQWNFTGSASVRVQDETLDVIRIMNVAVSECVAQYEITGGGLLCNTTGNIQLTNSQSGRTYQLFLNGSPSGVPKSGSTGSVINWTGLTSAGSYTVRGTNTSNGCSRDMIGTRTITVGVVPTVFSITGGNGFCAGASTGPPIVVNGAQAGVTYRLRYNTLLTDDNPGQSNGSGQVVFSNYVPHTGSSYAVIAVHATGCQSLMNGSVTLTQNPIPQIFNVGGSGAYCTNTSGASVALDNSQGGVQYQLKRSGSNIGAPISGTGSALTWPPQTAGTYTIEAAYPATGCSQTMQGSATVTAVPESVGGSVSPATANLYSGNGSLTVSLTGYTGTIMRWQENKGTEWTDFSFAGSTWDIIGAIITTTTQYRAVVKSGQCAEAFSNPVTITVYPAPVISGPSFLPFGGTPVTLSAQSTYSSYQWYKNDVLINGATGYQIQATEVGSYRVKVKALPSMPEITSDAFRLVTEEQSQFNLNYHKVLTLRKEGFTEVPAIPGLSPYDHFLDIEYLDGLGRTIQQVSTAKTPSRTDLITPVVYDNFGRVSRQYLPYTDNNYNGLLRTGAIAGTNGYTGSGQYQFYQSTPLVATSTAPFADQVYDHSPLSRVCEHGAPGVDWQPGSGNTIRRSWLVNSQDVSAPSSIKNIRKFTTSGPTGAFYTTGDLMVTKTIDENDHEVYSFTDKLGYTVLKRVQLDDVIDGVTVNWLDTYYVNDVRGNLILQVSPQAVHKLNTGTAWSANLQEQWCYTYTYDGRSRLTQNKVPGGGTTNYIYDRFNRLVFTQDGNQRVQNKWLFVKYDSRQRPVYSGVYVTTRTASELQEDVAALYGNENAPYFEKRGTSVHGYTNVSFPLTNQDNSALEILSVTYYDTYDFDFNGTDDYAYTPQELHEEETQFKAYDLVTGTKKRIVGTSLWTTSYAFYDRNGRLIQTRSNNHLSAAIDNLSTLTYDFEGKIRLMKLYHNAGSGRTTTILNRYTYDHAGRMKMIFQKTGNEAEVLLAQYVYNPLGQLIDKRLHCATCIVPDAVVNDGSSINYPANIERCSYQDSESVLIASNRIRLKPGYVVPAGKTLHAKIDKSFATYDASFQSSMFLQSVDYRYNIRGWLESINNAQLTVDARNDDTNDYFGMELVHEQADAGLGNTPLYNGGISAIKWKGGPDVSPGAGGQRSYVDTYDKADRLKLASFKAHSGSGWNSEVGTLNEALSYDVNGNILKLLRHQNDPDLGGTPELIDNLTYTYASGNRVNNIEDATLQAVGFNNNGVNTSDEFTYDTDGNLTVDKHKGIDSIHYNVLGKVRRIKFSNSDVITYFYDAAGNKVAQRTVKNSVPTLTDYLGLFVYENGSLDFISTAEGRVKDGAYEYAIKDHQGNVRVIFTSAPHAPQELTTDFESASNSNFQNYPQGGSHSPMNLFDYTDEGSVATSSQLLNGGNNSQIGVAKSYKVYPGDKLKIKAFAKYQTVNNNPGNLTGFTSALLSAYGVAPPSGGEMGTASAGLNAWGAMVASGNGGSGAEEGPKAFVNIVLFDKNFNWTDFAHDQVTPTANQVGASPDIPHDSIEVEYTVKEEGYALMYISNENATQVNVYFDDVLMSLTASNIIQYNEYYPFGLQTANSWTREDASNNFLGNGGTELNPATSLYDLAYRNYDPAIGRMLQMDPMADGFSSITPYNYSFNDPIYWSDPSGAIPCTFCDGTDGAWDGVTLHAMDGGADPGGWTMMNGQPMVLRDPFGNQQWVGGSMNYEYYSMAMSGFSDPTGIIIDGRALSSYDRNENGELGYNTWVYESFTEYDDELGKPGPGLAAKTIFVKLNTQGKGAKSSSGCPPGIDCNGIDKKDIKGALVDFEKGEYYMTSVYRDDETGMTTTYISLSAGKGFKNVPLNTYYVGYGKLAFDIKHDVPSLLYNGFGKAGFLLANIATGFRFKWEGFDNDHYKGLIWEIYYKDKYFPINTVKNE